MLQQGNKKIAKNTIYLYIRMLVSLLISLYTSRAFLYALGIEDFGIYNIVGGFVSLFGLITSSLTMGAQRFISYALGKGDKDYLKNIFSTFSNLFILLGVIVVALGVCIGHPMIYHFLSLPESRIDAAFFCFYCSLVAFAINLIAIPYTALVISHEKMDFYAIVSIGDSLMKLFIVYILYTSPFDRLKTYAILTVAVGVAVRIIYGFYCSRHFSESKLSTKIDKGILKESLTFSGWMAMGNVAVIAKEQGVNIVINLFCGVSINAARGISMQINNALNQFSGSLASAITPQITKNYAAGDIHRSIRLTFLLTKAQGLMLVLLAVPLYFEMDYILSIWLLDVPYYANVFAKWVVILCILSTLRNTYGPLYMASGQVKTLQWSTSLLYMLNLPLSYLMLKDGFEPVVTMQIAAVLEVLTWIASYYYMKYKFMFPLEQYFRETILPLLIITLTSSGLVYVVHRFITEEGFIRLCIVTLLSVATTLVLAYLLLLNKNERHFFVEAVSSKLKHRY